MKSKDCFVDNKGRVYKAESLRRAAADLPVISYHLKPELLKEEIQWTLGNFHDFINHFKRVRDADLEAPIILRSDGYIMDGWHRVMKALFEGRKKLPAKRFKINPKPDSTIAKRNKSIKKGKRPLSLASLQATLSNAEQMSGELFPSSCRKDRLGRKRELLGRRSRRIRRLEAVFISR